MSNTKFTETHEWVNLEGDTATVGITNFAQEQLGDIVYVEIQPDVGAAVAQGEECAVVESVKAAGDVKSPISGEITAINALLAEAPETVNATPEGDGWFYKAKISDADELAKLMDAAAYAEFVASIS